MKTRARTFFTVVVIAILLVGGFSFYRVITPRIVSRAVAPDGTEMCVVQWFNGIVEPFTTRFVFRKPGGLWGCFYVDHQDSLWTSSRVSIDPATGVAVFFRDGTPAITFAWASETFTLHRLNRTQIGPWFQLPPDWSPPTPMP